MRRSLGFTLIELVIVLALIGLGSALVAPAFLAAPVSDDGLSARVDEARRKALRGARTVTLSVDASLEIHVSPLGACTLRRTSGRQPLPSFDPVSCRRVGASPSASSR